MYTFPDVLYDRAGVQIHVLYRRYGEVQVEYKGKQYRRRVKDFKACIGKTIYTFDPVKALDGPGVSTDFIGFDPGRVFYPENHPPIYTKEYYSKEAVKKRDDNENG